jgi:IS30 family transposase
MANHRTFSERQFPYRLKRKGNPDPEIAELMGRDHSTIRRELKRNAGQRGYRPKQAEHQKLGVHQELWVNWSRRGDFGFWRDGRAKEWRQQVG